MGLFRPYGEANKSPKVGMCEIDNVGKQVKSAEFSAELFRCRTTFRDPNSQRRYEKSFVTQKRLKEIRFNILVAAVLSFTSMQMQHSGSPDIPDEEMWFFKMATPLLCLAVSGSINTKFNGDPWASTARQTTLVAAVLLFKAGIVWLNVMLIRADLANAQQQDLGTHKMVVFIQNSYIAQTFVWLVATALITIHGLGLRIRTGIPLAYASVMFQLVFAVAVNNELTDKGFEGDIIIPLRLMVVITVLLYMIQQRAWAAEIAQTKEFTIRIRAEEERQAAQKALDVVSKKKGSVGSLMGMVKGGMVKQMVRDVFSSDANTVQAANDNIKRFVDLAEEAVPLTAKRHDGMICSAEIPVVLEADQTPREGRPPSLSVETVAAAKTGLEIAMAWSERIAGFTQWKGDAVFLGGSCNPTTW
jgi:hypothetical protein